MQIINARLRRREGLYTLHIDNGKIASINSQDKMVNKPLEGDINAMGKLVIPPFIEPHIHLDYALSAGEPKWNMSGTLFEGIERWAERKPMLTSEDVTRRVIATLVMLKDNGIQHVRTHVDITDPSLISLKNIIDIKEKVSNIIDIQVVAFPQEGTESFPNARDLMAKAADMGVDVIGGIPHYENTREKGIESIQFIMDLAEKKGLLVDIHCDEIDDPQSRFVEILAEEARMRSMGPRVTASHTCAMGSYDNSYCYKLFNNLKKSGINFISCPTESIHLQGRFDSWPKRRGVTRVAELDQAGMNVCFAQDSIQDPWYPLGNGNILRTLDAGLHICHMMGYKDLQHCLDYITENSAQTLCLGDSYGIEEGRNANLVLLDAEDDYQAVQRQAKVLMSMRFGQVIMQREPEKIITPSLSPSLNII